MGSDDHDYLRRLDPSFYRGLHIVHWTHTINERATGWLSESFHLSFRENLIHTCFLHDLFCPAYCLMPDHFHVVLAGISEEADSREGTRWLRRKTNPHLKRKGCKLQQQAHDSVLRPQETERFAFEKLVGYVIENPVRAGLIEHRAEWEKSGSVLPGYPAVDLGKMTFEKFWEAYWKIYHRRINGYQAG